MQHSAEIFIAKLLNIEVKKYIDGNIVVWCSILFHNVKNFKNVRKIVLGIKCCFILLYKCCLIHFSLH